MKTKMAVNLALLLAAVWAGFAGAEQEQKVDDQGRVVMQADADGNRTAHAYAIDGKRVKTETARGERIDFTDNGRQDSPAQSLSVITSQQVQP